jgi:hypothetical protein
VAVGIALAFTWNVAGSHAPGAAETGSVVTPGVDMTVDQAAAQVWAGASPLTAAAGAVVRSSPQAPNGHHSATRSARQAYRTGKQAESGCRRVRPGRALRVRLMPVCRAWSHAPKKLTADSAMAR